SHIADEKAKDKMLDVEGIIDLAIHRKDGSWIVVDYKTDKLRSGETAEDLKHRLMEEYTP
ncbi:MAG: PD-(D/E)XK nuclease family protein, partial [Anaerotignum sp.]|nr:PD-(D/E)XK nuclease family protein [Anaerotignum sp.]